MTNSKVDVEPCPDGQKSDELESMIGDDDDREGCGICWLVFNEKRKPENPCSEESCRKAKQFCGPCVKRWTASFYAEDKNLGKPFLCPNCRTGSWGPPLIPPGYPRRSYSGYHRQGGVRRHPTSPISPRFQRRRPADFQHLQYRGVVSQAARGVNLTATAHPQVAFGLVPERSSHQPAYGTSAMPSGPQPPVYYTPAYSASMPFQPYHGYSASQSPFAEELRRLEQMRQDSRYGHDLEYRSELNDRLLGTLRANIEHPRARFSAHQQIPSQQPHMTPQQHFPLQSLVPSPPSFGHTSQPPPPTPSPYFTEYSHHPQYPNLMVSQPTQDSNEIFGYHTPSTASQRRHFPQRRSTGAPFYPPYPAGFYGGANPAPPSPQTPTHPLSNGQTRPPPFFPNRPTFGNATSGAVDSQPPSNFNSDLRHHIPVIHGVALSPQAGPSIISAATYGGPSHWQGPSTPNR